MIFTAGFECVNNFLFCHYYSLASFQAMTPKNPKFEAKHKRRKDGRFAAKPAKNKALTPPINADNINLGSGNHPSLTGLWPVPVEDMIPSNIPDYLARLRTAGNILDDIASTTGSGSGATVLGEVLQIRDRTVLSDAMLSLSRVASDMADEGLCEQPPPMSLCRPLSALTVDMAEIMVWGDGLQQGSVWAKRAGWRLLQQASYTESVLACSESKEAI